MQLEKNAVHLSLIAPCFNLTLRHNVPDMFLAEPLERRITLLAEVIRVGWAINAGETVRPSKTFVSWHNGILNKAVGLGISLTQCLREQDDRDHGLYSVNELAQYGHWLEEVVQGTSQYLRYVYNYEASTDCVIEESQSASGHSTGRVVVPEWLESGYGLCTLKAVPSTSLIPPVQAMPTGLVTGKTIHQSGDRWRIEYDDEAISDLERQLNCELRPYIQKMLAETVDDCDGNCLEWHWALDVPSLTNRQLDFEKRCAHYWKYQLELDVINNATKKARKRHASADEVAVNASRERGKFLRRYAIPAEAIVRVHRETGLSEWDVSLGAAWLKACIRLYPSVGNSLRWQYRGAAEGWYKGWIADLPAVVAGTLSNPAQMIKNLAELQKQHVTAARSEFRRTFHTPRVVVDSATQQPHTTVSTDIEDIQNPTEDNQETLHKFDDQESLQETLNAWIKLLSRNEAEIFSLLKEDASLTSTQMSQILGRPAGQIRVEKKRMVDKIRKVASRKSCLE